jgi:hypothetical protein
MWSWTTWVAMGHPSRPMAAATTLPAATVAAGERKGSLIEYDKNEVRRGVGEGWGRGGGVLRRPLLRKGCHANQ